MTLLLLLIFQLLLLDPL